MSLSLREHPPLGARVDPGWPPTTAELSGAADCFENPGEIDDKKAEIHQKIYGFKPGETVDYQNPPKDSLLKLSQDIRADAGPDARLMIVGYPQLFPSDNQGRMSLICPAEQRRLNTITSYMNAQVAAAAAALPENLEHVDVTTALQGHELGTEDPWIHDVDLGRGGPAGRSQESFHPTVEENNSISAILNQQIVDGR